MDNLEKFNRDQIRIVNNAVEMAEDLVSNFYKLSENQGLQRIYEVKTLVDLKHDEIVHGPFAQIIRYEGKRKDTSLGSSVYDYYKMCLQDHSILPVLKKPPAFELFPFILYIVTHELIHIIRFSKFLQNFEASEKEIMLEETRVHGKTHEILAKIRISGLEGVLNFYDKWRKPIENIQNL